jgi:hypothetical protein
MGRCRLLLAAGMLAASTAVDAQSPASDWRTIATPHFRVHFAAEFEPWARRAAGAIEGIHERVTEAVGYRPAPPIDVVVADPMATANGMAFPFLDRPVIVLWTSPPEAESAIGHWTDWMEDLVTHEVAHIVHLARPRNRSRGVLARLLPVPLGPLTLRSPRWLTEGYATVIEGALTGAGRPASSFRAMVLRRFAIEGKLPGYGALSATTGWLGGSMAYLVGSTFLEWLEAREGPGTLRKLWKRMASRRGGDFPTAFRAVFGRSPADLYDRFRAELTAAGIEEERRMSGAGLVGGAPWQRLDGGTLSLQVSPDGEKLLARRDPKRGETYLAVWALGETDEERESEKRRLAREAEIIADPDEVADRAEIPRRRAPRWRLPSVNGFAADNPRWLPDGERVLFARRAPDARGLLRLDLYLWRPESGEIRRVTRLADVAEADPAPDGAWAVGVRSRFGASELVRIDLASGETRSLPATSAAEDAWRVWSHPRVSPDGRTIAALLHSRGRWRLVTLPAAGGPPAEVSLPGSPAGEPAWSADGTRIFVAADREGVWNLESADPRPGGAPALLTRVTGGALAPAPSPDGRSLYFLEVTAKGVDVRLLSLPASELAAVARRPASFPLLPPEPAAVSPFARAEVGPSRGYRLWPSHVVRPLATYSVGPDGNAWQVGVEGTDVLGRLDWVAAASIGNAAGPRGGSISAAYRGLPVALTAHVFFAREQPGSQRVVRRPELDSERYGGFLEGTWSRPSAAGRLAVSAGGGASRVRPLAGGTGFDRSLISVRARATGRRVRGKSGFGGDVLLAGSLGRTAGSSWNQLLASAGVTAYLPAARVSASARYGDTAGSPTLFDLFAVGGAPSAVLPAGLDSNRVDVPALPAFVQTGERFESVRAEVAFSALPLAVYGERLRSHDPGGRKPDPVRVLGVELRVDEKVLPVAFPGDLAFYAGVAKIRSSSPRFDSTRGYAGLLYRP